MYRALYANQFVGEVPSEFGLLTALTTLVMEDNQLSSTIPTSLGLLTRLKTLYGSALSRAGMRSSRVQYLTPPPVACLLKRIVRKMHNNLLDGTIPSELDSGLKALVSPN